MKKMSALFLTYCLLLGTVQAQTGDKFSLPLLVTAQFHSIALPFHDLKGSFARVGVGLGTELYYNQRKTWVQSVHVLYYHNKAAGDGLMAYSQAAWRPLIGQNVNSGAVYAEASLGAGYLLAFRPTTAYEPVNGNWIEHGHAGKGIWIVPLGISVGVNPRKPGTVVAPYVSYQMMLALGYNPSVPAVPQTLLQVGSRLYFNK